MSAGRALRGAWVLSVGCALAACTTAVPEATERAAVPVPADWAAPVELDSFGPAVAGWEALTADPVLDRLLAEAQAHNRDLRAAAARVEQARALVRLERAGRRPQVNAAAASERRGDFNGNTLPEARSLGLDVAWELDLWGRLAEGVAAQAADFAAAEADLAAARRSLAAQVAGLWFDLVEARAQLALAEETAENYRSNERIIGRRFEAGLSRALDLRLARASRLAAESSAASARRRMDALARALEVLAGRYPARALEAARTLPETLGPPMPVLPGELVAARPDLQAAEARYAAAVHAAGAARKLRYPNLSLRGGAGTASEDLSDLFDSDFGWWNLVGNLTAPVFQGGRIAAQVEAASAGEVAALEAFAAALLRAYQEVETALAAEALLAAQVAVTAALVEEFEASEELAWAQYEKGLVGITTVLDSQRQAFSNRSQLLSLHNAQLQNRLDLLRSLGGPPLPAGAGR